jgi:ABC-2 type transport system ATP-binding protein
MGTDGGVVEVEGLWKDYGPLHALADVSFSIGEGEVFGLLGRNGSGKTTLLRILTGYRMPTSGSVRIAGMDIVRRSLAVRERIGYMPEHPQLYADLTVRGLLRFVANVRGLPRSERESRIEELASHFGLGAVIDRLAGHCSKGYRARISLAAAVLHKPVAVFLDEPTDGLDPEQRQQTHKLVRQLAKGSTVVLSSHDLDEVGVLCSRALVLDRGRVSRLGTIEELGGTAGIAEIFRQTHERDRGQET